MLVRVPIVDKNGNSSHRWVNQSGASGGAAGSLPAPKVTNTLAAPSVASIEHAGTVVDRLYRTTATEKTMMMWCNDEQHHAPEELAETMAQLFPEKMLRDAAEILTGDQRKSQTGMLMLGMIECANYALDPEGYMERNATRDEDEALRYRDLNNLGMMVEQAKNDALKARAIKALTEFDPGLSIGTVESESSMQAKAIINHELDVDELPDTPETEIDKGKLLVPLMLMNSVGNYTREQLTGIPDVRAKLQKIEDNFDRIIPHLPEFRKRNGLVVGLLDEFESVHSKIAEGML